MFPMIRCCLLVAPQVNGMYDMTVVSVEEHGARGAFVIHPAGRERIL